MAFAHTRPGEARKPEAVKLRDGRWRVTRFLELNTSANVRNGQTKAVASSIEGPVSGDYSQFAGLRLIDQSFADFENKPIQVLVYETLSATDEVQIGEPKKTKLEDGRDAWEYVFWQFSSNSYTPGTPGSSTAPDDANLYLLREETPDDGTLRQITRTYVEAGLLAQDDQSLQGGKLLRRTLTYAKTTPPTPSGYTLVGSPVQNPNGLPIYTYTFYKGDGEVSRRTRYSQSDDQGTTGVTTIDITHLTAASVGSDPTSSPGAGYEKVFEDKADRDGHRHWIVTYVKGTGTVSIAINSMNDGTRRVTYVSLGSRVAPSPGAIEVDNYVIDEGYKRYTVTARQAADGSAVTDGTYSVERYVPFTYPGRAKAFSEEYSSRTMLDVFRSPPVTALVKATVTVTYQTSNALGSITDLWNPKEWATLRAQWVGFGDHPHNLIEALPNYRSVSETAVEETCSAVAPIDVTIFGNPVYGGTTAKITVTGGPEDPGGNTYTLHAELDERPAFTDVDGTDYFRKTVITATIPAQDALPV